MNVQTRVIGGLVASEVASEPYWYGHHSYWYGYPPYWYGYPPYPTYPYFPRISY